MPPVLYLSEVRPAPILAPWAWKIQCMIQCILYSLNYSVEYIVQPENLKVTVESFNR